MFGQLDLVSFGFFILLKMCTWAAKHSKRICFSRLRGSQAFGAEKMFCRGAAVVRWRALRGRLTSDPNTEKGQLTQVIEDVERLRCESKSVSLPGKGNARLGSSLYSFSKRKDIIL